MDVKDAIKKRRSIRKYKDTPISSKIINELLEVARLAPSAYNAQPWKFKVVTDKKIIEELKSNEVFKNSFVYTSSLIIVCCSDDGVYPERAKDNFSVRELAIGDIYIASQNIVLRATELGLGSCYVGLFSKEKIKKVLEIPKEYIIPFVLVIGYADEEPGARTLKSMDEIRM